MSWQDRDYAADENPMRRFGRPGGDWQGIRPSLDNPMTWSVPLGRIIGIVVRIHLFFLIFIAVKLLQAAWAESTVLPLPLEAALLAALFAIVLLHEFGHCLACRATGGVADEILMWPLGGLAYCRPENNWKAHLVTVLGGPAVNVAIAAVLVPVLGVATGSWSGVAFSNPFTWGGLNDRAVAGSWVLQVVYLASQVNVIILLFNLLPIFPLDGGRIVQALLWPRIGYARSMRIAVRVGYVGAIALGIAGLVTANTMLVVIAVFGGVTCYITHRQLQFTQEMMGFESDQYAASLDEEPSRSRRTVSSRQRRRARREQRETRRVDSILQKIKHSGVESLTGVEKRLLRRETKKKKSG